MQVAGNTLQQSIMANLHLCYVDSWKGFLSLWDRAWVGGWGRQGRGRRAYRRLIDRRLSMGSCRAPGKGFPPVTSYARPGLPRRQQQTWHLSALTLRKPPYRSDQITAALGFFRWRNRLDTSWTPRKRFKSLRRPCWTSSHTLNVKVVKTSYNCQSPSAWTG